MKCYQTPAGVVCYLAKAGGRHIAVAFAGHLTAGEVWTEAEIVLHLAVDCFGSWEELAHPQKEAVLYKETPNPKQSQLTSSLSHSST